MRLLIVEDEEDLRSILKKKLMKEHYTADDCGNGLDALDYINIWILCFLDLTDWNC